VYRRCHAPTGWFREVETGKKKLQTGIWPVSCTIFRNLLAGIWGSFLRCIETGFRNWLAAFLGFFYDFYDVYDFPMIFQDFFIIFL